jgi:hypothetical protein
MKFYLEKDELWPLMRLGIVDHGLGRTDGSIELSDDEAEAYWQAFEDFMDWNQRLREACEEK